jgi:hypothetical protein
LQEAINALAMTSAMTFQREGSWATLLRTASTLGKTDAVR